MGTTALFALVPDQVFPVILVVAGIAVILGIVPRGAIMGLLLFLLLPVLFGPFLEGIFGQFPPWVTLAFVVLIGLAILRGLVSLVLGQGAADHMTGSLAADLMRFCFRLAFFPFRLLGAVFRMGR